MRPITLRLLKPRIWIFQENSEHTQTPAPLSHQDTSTWVVLDGYFDAASWVWTCTYLCALDACRSHRFVGIR